jgi:glycosyltransferase involved in cell wall biosynthesis
MPGAIVVPAFNEAASLGSVLERVIALQVGAEIVVVDDGSRDATARVAASFRATVIRHRVNLGYTAAVQTGLLYALHRRHEYAITFDADGQHDPAAIPVLLDRASREDHPDIVIGSRFLGAQNYKVPIGRSIGMRAFSWLTRPLGGRRIRDTTSGLKLMSAAAIATTATLAAGDLHSELIIYCLLRGLHVVEVPVTMHPRTAGISMHGAMSAVAYPLRTILALAILRGRARREGAL